LATLEPKPCGTVNVACDRTRATNSPMGRVCATEAEASDYPQTLPPMDLVPLPPVKVESESTDRVMWSVAAAMLTVLIGTVAVFGWWLRKTAVQIQTSKVHIPRAPT
jgi:hypothetical protein